MKHPVDTAETQEGFLQRFHRRKVAARRGELTSAEPDRAEIDEKRRAADSNEKPVLTDDDMPPVESLTADSDFSGFLSDGVSETLRREALRRLWRVADFEFVDDLDIYASDYTNFEPLGGIVTAEMQHRMELEAKRQMEKLAEVDEPDVLEGEPASEDEVLLAQAPQQDGEALASIESGLALEEEQSERET